MQWQPIETAPKDATEILAWSRRDGTSVVFWNERKKAWMWTCHDFEATHWMPLPEPPSAE